MRRGAALRAAAAAGAAAARTARRGCRRRRRLAAAARRAAARDHGGWAGGGRLCGGLGLLALEDCLERIAGLGDLGEVELRLVSTAGLVAALRLPPFLK